MLIETRACATHGCTQTMEGLLDILPMVSS